MLEYITTARRSSINEDYQFALWMQKHGGFTPLMDTKRGLFVEELTPPNGNTPLGVHKVWAYMNYIDIEKVLSGCMMDIREEGGEPIGELPPPSKEGQPKTVRRIVKDEL